MRSLLPSAPMRSAALLAWIVLAVGAFASSAYAQDASAASEADALIEEGVQLREQGRDEDAVAVFRRARAIDDAPRARAQLGLALLATGVFVESYELLEAVLASDDPWVTDRRSALEASFASAAAHVGTLEITGDQGGRLRVNGVDHGTLPLTRPLHVASGRAVVEVAREGFHTYVGEAAIEARAISRLRVELIALPASETTPAGGDDWIVPAVIVGSVLVVAGVVTGLAIGLQQPSYERGDVGGVVMTLTVPW